MGAGSRGIEMIRIVGVLVGLTTVAVSLRVYARMKKRVGLGTDDYLAFVALILLYAMYVEMILWCEIGGNGKHIQEVTPIEMDKFFKIFLSNQFTYIALSGTIKISFICFFRRLFIVGNFQHFSFGINCLIGVWTVACFLACALQCRPLRAFWDKTVEGHCFDENTYFIVIQSFNVAMEVIIFCMPIPMIWGLQRPWRGKLALLAVFLFGAFVVFASIYRIVVLFQIHPPDVTWTIYDATLWTHVEPSLGLLCSCLPTIKGLFPVWPSSATVTAANRFRMKYSSWGYSWSRSGNRDTQNQGEDDDDGATVVDADIRETPKDVEAQAGFKKETAWPKGRMYSAGAISLDPCEMPAEDSKELEEGIEKAPKHKTSGGIVVQTDISVTKDAEK